MMPEMGTRPAGGAGRKRRGLVVFLIGVLVGVLAAVFAPRFLGDYLPGSIGSKGASVTGVVTKKLTEEARVLLTVVTDSGAVLAAFVEKRTEIDLLIEEGDSVTFSLAAYSPFVDDPRLGRVTKPVQDARAGADSGGSPGMTEAGEPDPENGSEAGGRPTPGQVPADTAAETGTVAPNGGSVRPTVRSDTASEG